jgi:hypothetical protein
VYELIPFLGIKGGLRTRSRSTGDLGFSHILGYLMPPPPAIHVAWADSYHDKTIDIDGDGIYDLSHGEVCVRYLKAAAPPSTTVDRWDLTSFNLLDLVTLWNKLALKVKQGKHFAAIGSSTIVEWEYLASSGITADNIHLHRNKMLRIWQLWNKQVSKQIRDYIASLQTIIRQGIPVYLTTGNNGQQTLAIGNLARGVHAVGALNADGKRAAYSGLHSFVNRYEQGTYNAVKVKGGYDITEDGKLDVKDSEVSTKGRYHSVGQRVKQLAGTSYAAPTALGKDLWKIKPVSLLA